MRHPEVEEFLYRLVDQEGVKVGILNGVRFEFVFVDPTPRFKRVVKSIFRHIVGGKRRADSEAF